MPRYFMRLAYHGTPYHGWQRQQNAHSVQEELEKALHTILNEEIAITGSGRTDTGVHAKAQVAHFDSSKRLEIKRVANQLNGLLPMSIAIDRCWEVAPDAHARFDAIYRSYAYHIHKQKSPFLEGLSYFYRPDLNIEKMNIASQSLLGVQDFKSFSKVKTEVNHFNCEILEAYWEIKNNDLIFNVKANRFLRGMVRALVGTLMDVGREKIDVSTFERIIAARNRGEAGRAVPPQGLYLTEVAYPKSIEN